MLLYRPEKNTGPVRCSGDVVTVNGNEAEVNFADFTGQLRYRRADTFWDSNSHESCRLISHTDLSGGESIALVCPRCGECRRHKCPASPKASSLPYWPGDRLTVYYPPAPGIDDGEYPASVVRAAGHVIRVHFDYDDESCDSIHIAYLPDRGWLDIDLDVPCELKRVSTL